MRDPDRPLTDRQMEVLRCYAGRRPLMSDIAFKLGISRCGVLHHVDALLARRLLRRVKPPGSRRGFSITKKGRLALGYKQ